MSDRYKVIEEIGRGCYGTVVKAIDPMTGEIVAIKKVKVFNPSQSLPQSFYREVSNLQQLKHNNIIELKDVIRTENNSEPYLVFNYCEFDLDGLIHQRFYHGLNLKTVKCYFKQILEAVKYCHDNNIIHRDLKPANIFITRHNVVKLGDFGLSRDITKGNPLFTTNVVTPGYRAPELILGNKNYDQSSDMWSLGAILFEMLTGHKLFKPTTPTDMSQLYAIVSIMGKPKLNEIQNYSNINLLNMINDTATMPFEEFLRGILPNDALSAIPLLISLLQYNPEERMTADEALASPFLRDSEEPDNLPIISFAETHSLDNLNDNFNLPSAIISPPVRPLSVKLIPILVN